MEPRQRVDGAVGARDFAQWILRRAAATDSRLYMAGRALIRGEARGETIFRALPGAAAAHDFYEAESCHAVLKEIQLVLSESCERLRRSILDRRPAHAGIRGLARGRRSQRGCCDE